MRLTPAAGTDPLFAGARRPSPCLRPARDPLHLPADAVVLASCEGGPEQAFRIGGSAWGVRFLRQDGAADPWAADLLGRFAALVTSRSEHTAARAFFTRRAEAWEERFAHQTPAYEAGAARMRLAPGGVAVDLGCGTGRAMPALREQVGAGGRVLGIDVTPAMLAAAARHGRPLDPADLLAEDNLRPALERAGRHLDAYEDTDGHFLARAAPRDRRTRHTQGDRAPGTDSRRAPFGHARTGRARLRTVPPASAIP
ncbi:methyltransferase domain-containing protein [Streptomyces erythrochromogenes]|uniref:methyltransferase domain-containing protein n=1 Tax=Streptomyces erythrochromogenes TaxID=285574 RepID=UPI00370113AF